MDMIIYLAIGLVVGVVIGILVGRYVMASSTGDAATVAGLAATNTSLLSQIDDLKSQVDALRDAERLRASEESKVLERLAPVHTLLNQVEGRVREMENERKTQFRSIDDQLKQARTDGEALRTVTQGLKSALSDPNIRGHWGETQLERLLEAAGMVKGIDFITQDQIAGTDDEKGSRPDAIVKLPDGGQIIIDAKVTLTNYLRAAEETDPKQRVALLKQHAKDVALKAKELADKKYWQRYDLSADYVILFMPTEAALAEALQVDPSIYDTALRGNVAIATPISLFTTLKSVAFLWRQHDQTNQIHEVINKTRALIDTLGKTADDVNTFAKSLGATVNNYNTFASRFENSLIGAAVAIPGVTDAAFPTLTTIDKAPRELADGKIAKANAIPRSAKEARDLDLVVPVEQTTMDTDGEADSK
jgi:DNA recombination protein RmuC